MEDGIVVDPEKFLGEPGLKLLARQYRVGPYIFDLLFEDRHGAKLIVELQHGTLDRDHTYKILDYYEGYKYKRPNEFIEVMLVANRFTYERRLRLSDKGIAWREIPEDKFFSTILQERCKMDSSIDINKNERNINTLKKASFSTKLKKVIRSTESFYLF
jgi:RecB family endonuclease NucS